MESRLAFFSDIHGNSVALRAVFVNVGSAGRPTDGCPRSNCTALTLPELGVEVRRVPYDVEEIAGAGPVAGLPAEFGEASRRRKRT
jgi:hypothetical protein